jgi:hypothetical protein
MAASSLDALAFADLKPEQRLETFKFYEEAAEKAKEHAWSQTTWLLSLNAALLALSVTLYLDHRDDSGYLLLEAVFAVVGVALCGFLIYLLRELGKHIQHYWTTSNRLAASTPMLQSFISPKEMAKTRGADYRADFPAFCRRLQVLAGLFGFAHVGLWALMVCLTEGI